MCVYVVLKLLTLLFSTPINHNIVTSYVISVVVYYNSVSSRSDDAPFCLSDQQTIWHNQIRGDDCSCDYNINYSIKLAVIEQKIKMIAVTVVAVAILIYGIHIFYLYIFTFKSAKVNKLIKG